MSPAVSWTVAEGRDGERLDRALADRLQKPRNQVRRWISQERVAVNGRVAVKPATQLHAGDTVEWTAPPEVDEPALEPESGELDVLFEDPGLAVIDKPAGLVVHPGAGHRTGTLAHFLLDRYPEVAGVGGEGRPGIVHRLDLDTTGALVVARSEPVYLALSTAFAERRVHKTYLAIVYGTPKEDPGRIDRPIGRHRHHRQQMQIRPDGRPAVTRYRTLDSAMGISRLEIDLETGRTHQIRVHLKAIGHPLVGDPVYGEARWRNLPRTIQRPLREFSRPALHAWRLAFEHPLGGDEVAVEAPVPDDLRRLWRSVTGREWSEPIRGH